MSRSEVKGMSRSEVKGMTESGDGSATEYASGVMAQFTVTGDGGRILDSGTVKIYLRPTPELPTPFDYLIIKSRTDLCAYINGVYTDYRNGSLRQLRLPEHQSALIPDSTGYGGVQYRGRYGAYIPEVLRRKAAAEFPRGSIDTTVRTSESAGGTVVAEYSFRYRAGNPMPSRVRIQSHVGENMNIGTELYYTSLPKYDTINLSDSTLHQLLPFLTGRSKDFIGWPMPGYSVPTPDHGRFSYNPAEVSDRGTVLVFMPADGDCRDIMARGRSVAAENGNSQIIWALDDNRPERARAVLSDIRSCERVVLRGESIFKAVGITMAPAILVVDEEGIIREISQL
ncbi:MAG: hypothetical protein K2M79_05970 [Muribaculaceae bacterium]|nr:hypothetical protein [Muribaculaceae bacterium]